MSVPVRRSLPPPARMAHMGLGAFFRAHQAYATHVANAAKTSGNDAGAAATLGDQWGIVAFTGRSPQAAHQLTGQDNCYTLVTRDISGTRYDVIESIVASYDGGDLQAWRETIANPAIAVITLTVTESGYWHTAEGSLRADAPEIMADLAALAAGIGCQTAPGRLVDGLRSRREHAKGGRAPCAVVSCDNLPNNGEILRRVVTELALAVDESLAEWLGDNISFVSSMVDRITPATTTSDIAEVGRATGITDVTPVITEPELLWVLRGEFSAGRPAWEVAGAEFVADVEPYERRKLWLLNAGHSLLAYYGLTSTDRKSAGGETVGTGSDPATGQLDTVYQAFLDARCRTALETLWREAGEVLPFESDTIDAAVETLRRRFGNPNIQHKLEQIALGGMQKIPVRIGELIAARLAAGLPAGESTTLTIASWLAYLSREQTPASERAALVENPTSPGLSSAVQREQLVQRALALVAPTLLDYPSVVAEITAHLNDIITSNGARS